MTENDLRGGCKGMPLELTGEWTGYNNGATMQVGLWIANDGDHIAWAQRHALDGPFYLRQVLTSLMEDSYRDERRRGEEMLSVPASVWLAATRSEGGTASIDWAQITYDLVGSEPDDAEIAAAATSGRATGRFPGGSCSGCARWAWSCWSRRCRRFRRRGSAS